MLASFQKVMAASEQDFRATSANLSETEILAQLEVTGLSAFSLQGERENCAAEAFASEFCQHGQFPLLYYRSRSACSSSQQLKMPSKGIKAF